MMSKIYVDVEALHTKDGALLPMSIRWIDGREYAVDRVLDVRKAASLKAGGIGIRYTCRICGKERYIWYENPSWFVEGKEP